MASAAVVVTNTVSCIVCTSLSSLACPSFCGIAKNGARSHQEQFLLRFLSSVLQVDPLKPKKTVGKKLGTDMKSGGGLNPIAIFALLIAIACGVYFSQMKK